MLKSALFALSLTVSSIAIISPAVAQTDAAKPAPAPVDPARLKMADQVVLKLIPPGTYQRMMKDMMDTMAGGLIEQMMGMDAAIIAGMAGEGEDSDAAKAVEGKTMADIAGEKDPHFKERMDIMMKVMFSEMGNLMSEMEPTVRTALSSIYARKYTAKELSDMNAFFATPSGTAFAGNFMSSFTDKEMMDASFGMMPKIMEAMPAIMKKVEAATAHLPPMPKSDEEAAMDAAIAEATTAVEDAAENPYANETGEEPWYVEDNWKPASQKKAAKLSKTYDAASEKSGAAYAAFEEAQMAAIDEARKRYLADGWKPEVVDAPMAAEDIPADAVPPPAIPK
jgi:Uncharacterized protein conserved in bacteria (DUF2059)